MLYNWIWRRDEYKNKHEGKKNGNEDLRMNRISNRIAVFYVTNYHRIIISLEDRHYMMKIKIFYKRSYRNLWIHKIKKRRRSCIYQR